MSAASIGIELEGVAVEFPVFGANARSLKNSLLSKGTGGRIGRGAGGGGYTVRALRDVTIALERGDRVGLVGANGAGKTTLLRVLAGVYRPTHGAVRRRGRVAPLFDIALGIDPEATGHENIVMRGMLLGLSRAEIRERAGEIGEFTELGGYLAMPVHTYSAGMRLRLAFAVCTCIEPEILLMDEWIGVGDAAFIDKAERRLREFVDRAGILVLASHAPGLLERVCDTGILLESGRIAAAGPIAEVLRAYGRSPA